jgi:CheY-like chemotaxis protein
MNESSSKIICRVLIIEDTKDRQRILTDLYRSHAWVLVDTGRRAITLLTAFEFDIISLDYNLRGEFTGEYVANAIVESNNRKARIVIHSMNPRGVIRIAQVLPNAVQFPVYKMIKSNGIFKMLRSRIDTLGSTFDWTI